MAIFGSPSPQWTEKLATATALERMYWHYDAVGDVWTVTPLKSSENGALRDIGGGVFQLALLSAIGAGVVRLRVARRSGDTIIIY